MADEDKNSLLSEYADKSKGGDSSPKKKTHNESALKLHEKQKCLKLSCPNSYFSKIVVLKTLGVTSI